EACDRKPGQRNVCDEIGRRRHENEAQRKVMVAKLRPTTGLVPVIRVRLGELRTPSLQQADDGDDRDRDAERKKAAPFAGAGETEKQTGNAERHYRSLLAVAVD